MIIVKYVLISCSFFFTEMRNENKLPLISMKLSYINLLYHTGSNPVVRFVATRHLLFMVYCCNHLMLICCVCVCVCIYTPPHVFYQSDSLCSVCHLLVFTNSALVFTSLMLRIYLFRSARRASYGICTITPSSVRQSGVLAQ